MLMLDGNSLAGVVAPFQLNLLSITTDRVWVAMWVERRSKKVSFCLIILARVPADTLSAT
jgi:hypothetical protein